MLQPHEVETAIGKRLMGFIAETRIRPSDGTIVLYVRKSQVSSKATNRHTSRRQMDRLGDRLGKAFGVEALVIYMADDIHLEREQALRRLLSDLCDIEVKYLHVSSFAPSEGRVEVHVEVGEEVDEALRERMTERCLGMLGLAAPELSLAVTGPARPSLLWLLRLIKTKQPLDLQGICARTAQDYPDASRTWLNHRLDRLRKQGLVLREKSGSYALTAEGLSLVPAGAERGSSDIDRVLDMRRKKW